MSTSDLFKIFPSWPSNAPDIFRCDCENNPPKAVMECSILISANSGLTV